MVHDDGTLTRTPYVRLLTGLRKALPELAGLVDGDVQDFHSLRIVSRAEGDILCVLKRYGDDGTILVTFGSGADFVTSLLAVESAVANSRWRVDVPWEKRRNSG